MFTEQDRELIEPRTNLNYHLSSPSWAGVLTFPNLRLDFRPAASHHTGYGQTSGSAGRQWPAFISKPVPCLTCTFVFQKGQACKSVARQQGFRECLSLRRSPALWLTPEEAGASARLGGQSGQRVTLACSSSSSPTPSLTRVPASGPGGGGASVQTPSGRQVSSHFGYGPVKSIPSRARSKRIRRKRPQGLWPQHETMFLKHWDCSHTRKHALKTFPVPLCPCHKALSAKEKVPSLSTECVLP